MDTGSVNLRFYLNNIELKLVGCCSENVRLFGFTNHCLRFPDLIAIHKSNHISELRKQNVTQIWLCEYNETALQCKHQID